MADSVDTFVVVEAVRRIYVERDVFNAAPVEPLCSLPQLRESEVMPAGRSDRREGSTSHCDASNPAPGEMEFASKFKGILMSRWITRYQTPAVDIIISAPHNLYDSSHGSLG